MSAVASIRVFICDDVAELRDLLRVTFEGEADLAVVGQADNGVAGLLGIKDTQPDVVVLDLSMPGRDGLEVLETIRDVAPDSRVVVFSGFAPELMGEEARRRGALAYVAKGEPLGDLIAAVRRIATEDVPAR
jgi:DNA-binding NarL/FixJ family response regulator